MGRINPVAETADTVTLRRVDFEALLRAAEDAADNAVVEAHEARIAAEGREAVLADFLPADLAVRLLAGESPIAIWRERRALTQRELAARAALSATYLNDLEAGRRQGSPAVLARIAAALGVTVDELITQVRA